MYLITHLGMQAQAHVACNKLRIYPKKSISTEVMRQRSLQRRNRRRVIQTVAQRSPEQTLQPSAFSLAYHLACVVFQVKATELARRQRNFDRRNRRLVAQRAPKQACNDLFTLLLLTWLVWLFMCRPQNWHWCRGQEAAQL